MTKVDTPVTNKSTSQLFYQPTARHGASGTFRVASARLKNENAILLPYSLFNRQATEKEGEKKSLLMASAIWHAEG